MKNLQRGPDERKKRWLIVSSAIAMLLVLLLWLAYLNLTLPRLSATQVAVSSSTPPEETGSQKESFLQTFGRGLSVTFGNIANGLTGIKNTLVGYFEELKNQMQKSNNFSLSGVGQNFLPVNPEPVPSTKLP